MKHPITISLKGVELELETSKSVFSPRAIDRGTLAMLSVVEFDADDRVLDLGCGYGVVGILAARLLGPKQVVMIDNDAEAVSLAQRNAARNGVPDVLIQRSHGFEDTRETHFTKILCNPPYHEDFSVPKHFIEKGFNRLVIGGEMFIVTRRRKWYENKLRSIFGGAAAREVNSYTVLTAQKRRAQYAGRG